MQLKSAPSLCVTRVSGLFLMAALTAGCPAGMTADVPPGTGGSVGTGGRGTGGQPGTGGGVGTGGSGSGGATGSGGQTASGGATGSGGVAPDGGAQDARGGTGGGTGSGGSSGAGGAGPVMTTCMSAPPTAPTSTAAFPFPQHRASSACIYPTTCSDASVDMGWQKYKAKFVVDGVMPAGSLRVQGGQTDTSTVSEGMAYGMLFAVYMNDKATFDKLWMYVNGHLDRTGLMNWYIDAGGTTNVRGMNSATDADEDMAFALVMADKQWGGYTTVAKDFLAKVLTNDFETDGSVKGGDQYKNAINPSYLAPAYYKIFAMYSGDDGWNKIVTRTYDILTMAANATTGLVPDWVSGQTSRDYKYDAARTPFRVALDACWFGDTQAQAFSQKIAAFFAGIGAASIKDGYNLNGTAIGTNTNATFVGPAGVGAMAGNQPKLLQDAYTFVADTATKGTDSYYNSSWALLSVMFMTGNFVNFFSP